MVYDTSYFSYAIGLTLSSGQTQLNLRGHTKRRTTIVKTTAYRKGREKTVPLFPHVAEIYIRASDTLASTQDTLEDLASGNYHSNISTGGRESYYCYPRSPLLRC